MCICQSVFKPPVYFPLQGSSSAHVHTHVHTLHIAVPTHFHSQREAWRGRRRSSLPRLVWVTERAHRASAMCCRETYFVCKSDAFIVKIHFRSCKQTIYHKDSYQWASCPLLCAILTSQLTSIMGGVPHLQIFFFFFSVSVLNLLKVKTQRPLGAGQPTPQMAGGSEAVSTLKRAKSRGFSSAGEDGAWMGHFHQPL